MFSFHYFDEDDRIEDLPSKGGYFSDRSQRSEDPRMEI